MAVQVLTLTAGDQVMVFVPNGPSYVIEANAIRVYDNPLDDRDLGRSVVEVTVTKDNGVIDEETVG